MKRSFAFATSAFVAATVLGAVCAVVLAAEAGLRALRPRPEIISEWLLALPDWFDDGLIFSDPAFRGDDIYRTERRPLVVFLGDSFTLGYPVASADAYPSVVETTVATHGARIDKIVLAIGNIGPDQELRLFERELLPRTTPDVVVWQLYTNDEYDNVDRPVYGIAPNGKDLSPLDATRNWLYRRQVFHEAFPGADWLLGRSYLYRRILRIFERAREAAVPAEYSSNPHAWGLAKIALETSRMRELAARLGFRVYFMLIAPQELYLTGEKRPEPVQAYSRLYDLLEKEPGWIDARFYEADGRTLQRDIFADGGRDKLAIGARHFDERGYRRLAALVAERLLSDGALASSRRLDDSR